MTGHNIVYGRTYDQSCVKLILDRRDESSVRAETLSFSHQSVIPVTKTVPGHGWFSTFIYQMNEEQSIVWEWIDVKETPVLTACFGFFFSKHLISLNILYLSI